MELFSLPFPRGASAPCEPAVRHVTRLRAASAPCELSVHGYTSVPSSPETPASSTIRQAPGIPGSIYTPGRRSRLSTPTLRSPLRAGSPAPGPTSLPSSLFAYLPSIEHEYLSNSRRSSSSSHDATPMLSSPAAPPLPTTENDGPANVEDESSDNDDFTGMFLGAALPPSFLAGVFEHLGWNRVGGDDAEYGNEDGNDGDGVAESAELRGGPPEPEAIDLTGDERVAPAASLGKRKKDEDENDDDFAGSVEPAVSPQELEVIDPTGDEPVALVVGLGKRKRDEGEGNELEGREKRHRSG